MNAVVKDKREIVTDTSKKVSTQLFTEDCISAEAAATYTSTRVAKISALKT